MVVISSDGSTGTSRLLYRLHLVCVLYKGNDKVLLKKRQAVQLISDVLVK